MASLLETIKHRTSIRAFRGDGFWQEDQQKTTDIAEAAQNPYQIPISWELLNAKEHGLTSPVISGTDIWLAGKMKRVPNAEEAFGYEFEEIVLNLDSIGIGTTIIAGTMNRDAFEKSVDLQADEVLPCVTPLGYPAKKRGLKELAMRKAIGADKRIEVKEFVFDKSFGIPASDETIGKLAETFELVRWVPSAVNKQPWRIVLDGNKVHFYKKTGKGYIDTTTGWDIQKIDIGIAMKHFVLGAEAAGLAPALSLEDPGIATPADVEYISSYII